MRKEILNGTPIPYEYPIVELKAMMASSEMKDFTLACEALSYHGDPEAYEIMKSYANDKDKYRRLYILKTIFRRPEAVDLVGFLESAIASDDFLFVDNGLLVVAEHGIKVSDDLLLSVVSQNLDKLYTGIRALRTLEISEDHYIRLTELFRKASQCGQKQIISDVLVERYLPYKAEPLFELFRGDPFAGIRLLAVKLAGKYGYDLSKFFSDMDGHVRKLAAKSLGELSFLSPYMGTYFVDVSDDLASAVIYNPTSDEHLYIDYEKVDSYAPYTLLFSFQHVHVSDKESSAKWIDDILTEKLYAIEYFRGDERRFGGEITADELRRLSYELLEQDTGFCGTTKLSQLVDNFKVRGWSGRHDFDGHLIEKDGKISIETLFW